MTTVKQLIEFLIQNKKCSTTILKDKFGIGYNLGSCWIDYFESIGFISGFNGSKERDVLITDINQVKFKITKDYVQKEINFIP